MSVRFTIPESLARINIEMYGRSGEEWLRKLPELLAEYERKWSLRIGPPFAGLSYNYAAPATRVDATVAVLKAGYPGRELETEAEALRLYDGRGAARLLAEDVRHGVLLIEWLSPGTRLTDVPGDSRATSIAAQLMKQLWRPVPQAHPFPTVADWAQGMVRLRAAFNGGTGPYPPALVDEAETLFAVLLSSQSEQVLLHGDLHHGNILEADRQPWLAIDPKGVVGEAAYEVGAFLRNPMPDIAGQPGLGRILRRRIDQFAEELGFDKLRLRDWGLAQAVLSAWWSYEDEGRGWDGAIAIAEALAAIKS